MQTITVQTCRKILVEFQLIENAVFNAVGFLAKSFRFPPVFGFVLRSMQL